MTIEDRVESDGEGVLILISTNQLSMIEVFGNTTKKEVKLDNLLSFDQYSISSLPVYTDFELRNVPTDPMIVINSGRTTEEVLIPRGAYDIETIIAMLNASDALFEVVYSGDNAIHITMTNSYTVVFRKAPGIPIDPRIWIKGVGEESLQSTTILPEYLV